MENTNPPTRQILTADEFIFILQGSEEAQKKYPMYYRDMFNNGELYVVIIDAEIKTEVVIEKITFHLPIMLQSNIDFEGRFSVNNVLFQKKIFISGAIFHKTLFLSFTIFQEGLNVYGCIFKDEFRLLGLHFSAKGIVDLCLEIANNNHFQNNVIIDGATFEKDAVFGGIFDKSMNINNASIFKKDVQFSGKFNHDIQIRGGEFMQEVFFRDSHVVGEVKILAGQFNEILFSEELQCKNIEIKSYQTYPKLSINKLSISHAQFEKICINKGTAEKLEINSLTFSNAIYNKDTMIQLVDIQPKELRFENVQNISGNIVLSGINANSEAGILAISNSDLGRVNLIDCNFEPYELAFHSSKIIDVFVAGTNMPKPENINQTQLSQKTPHSPEYARLLDQKRLALMQIKKVYESRGDYVKARKYHAEEMETYRQILKGEKEPNKRSEGVLLWLNMFSNFHGQEWARAFLLTLSISFLLFCIYLFSLKSVLPSSPLSAYFAFLSPVHRYDFLIKDIEKYPVSKMIDDISRIIITYFEYQLVQAFRKHGKR